MKRIGERVTWSFFEWVPDLVVLGSHPTFFKCAWRTSWICGCLHSVSSGLFARSTLGAIWRREDLRCITRLKRSVACGRWHRLLARLRFAQALPCSTSCRCLRGCSRCRQLRHLRRKAQSRWSQMMVKLARGRTSIGRCCLRSIPTLSGDCAYQLVSCSYQTSNSRTIVHAVEMQSSGRKRFA